MILFLLIGGVNHYFIILFSYWCLITTIKTAIATQQKIQNCKSGPIFINWVNFSNREKRLNQDFWWKNPILFEVSLVCTRQDMLVKASLIHPCEEPLSCAGSLHFDCHNIVMVFRYIVLKCLDHISSIFHPLGDYYTSNYLKNVAFWPRCPRCPRCPLVVRYYWPLSVAALLYFWAPRKMNFHHWDDPPALVITGDEA